jgi:hypothetical protein
MMSDGFTPASAPAAFSLAARFIKCAARGAPPALAGRLEEEWLADLAAQPSTLAGLSFALGCFRATWIIAREHRAASARVAATAGGSKTLMLGRFRSLSMTRFSSLWIAVAALAVTSLVIFAVSEVGKLASFMANGALAEIAHLPPSDAFWWALAISAGSLLMFPASLHRVRVERRHDGGPRPPRVGAAFVLGALIILATSVLWFAAGAYFAFTPNVLPGLTGSKRWALVLFFAEAGGVFLMTIVALYRNYLRLGGGPGLSGSSR